MTRRADYRAVLRDLADWEPFLRRESGLPGPRANLELVQAVADEGSLEAFKYWLTLDDEFLALCGAVGLGRFITEQPVPAREPLLDELRIHASDQRWRVREGVAMALQRVGAQNMAALLEAVREWSTGSWLECRAVVAALCEPALVRDRHHALAVLEVLDNITASLHSATDRRAEDFKVLRKALAYGWSVAAVGSPETGKALIEKWLHCADRDINWIMRENLKKDRLTRMDPAWVIACRGNS